VIRPREAGRESGGKRRSLVLPLGCKEKERGRSYYIIPEKKAELTARSNGRARRGGEEEFML